MKKLSRNLVSMIMLLVLLMLILAGVYAYGIYHFKTHFFTGSHINGIDVGEMTVDDAKYAIQSQMRRYTITLNERNNTVEKITGDQIYMQYYDDGSIEKLLNEQDTNLWILHLGGRTDYDIQLGFTYDKNVIDSVMSGLACFSAANSVAPTDATIVDNGTSFSVVESTEGSTLDYDRTKQAIMEAIEGNQTELDFEALSLYKKPSEYADSEGIQSKIASINTMLSSNIVYDFVDRTYTIDSTVVRDFLTESNGEYTLSRDKIAAWVYKLAYDTDTFGMSHKFKTVSGNEITLKPNGDYGWCINQEETTTDLYNAIMQGYQGEREPVYLYRAMDRSSYDIGDTYVEICIEKQEMWCYKDGVLIVDTPIVTGCHAWGLDTPSGCVWAIDGKEYEATFEQNGFVKVTYWLPFFDSCGIHDASWRTAQEFGGDTWLYNGSDGCVNTPKDAAEKIFNVMDKGYPVVVYYSESQVEGTQPTNEILPG